MVIRMRTVGGTLHSFADFPDATMHPNSGVPHFVFPVTSVTHASQGPVLIWNTEEEEDAKDWMYQEAETHDSTNAMTDVIPTLAAIVFRDLCPPAALNAP
jgi:hypothetical protein